MNTLRVKIAMLLVVAIVSVVGLVTALVLYLARPPNPPRFIEAVAQQVELLAKLAKSEDANALLSETPPSGDMDPTATERIRSVLRARGSTLEVTVYREGPGERSIVSIPVADGRWLLAPIQDLSPPGGASTILIGWLLLITIGAAVIAVFVANRMVQPLVLLDNAIASVGPDAILPVLPDRGPAEVRAAARALNTLSSRLKSAIESRMRLVAAAGHDLRTPITRMRLRAEFVQDGEDRGAWLRDIDELERIADSAILLVREETGKPASKTVRLDQVVAQIAAELRDQNLDVFLTDSQPVTVRVGPLALTRALRNLMINAATHGKQARVVVDALSGAMARVTILDEGPGIPPELIGQVFEPFFRVDSARRQNTPGAGLGLTIAREIIRRAGGDIRIANREDRGLSQVVELPLASDAAAGAPKRAERIEI